MNLSADETRPDAQEKAGLRSQVHLVKSVWARRAYFAVGTVSLVLGMIGLLLPVVPTTPFLLLTAHCYALSSERFYLWVVTNRFFGEYIRDWREHRGIPLRTKIWVILLLWIAIGASMAIVPLFPVQLGLGFVSIGVSFYIWRQPTKVVVRTRVAQDLKQEKLD